MRNISEKIIVKIKTHFFEVRHPRCVSTNPNVECIQYDVKHNLVLDGILVY